MIKVTTVILAAGKSTRFKGPKSKLLQELAGLPIICHVVNVAKKISGKDVVIVCNKNNIKDLKLLIKDCKFVIQKNQKGTADAMNSAKKLIKQKNILILFGDVPLITIQTIKKLISNFKKNNSLASMLAFNTSNPYGYGRIKLKKNKVLKVIEEINTNKEEKKITICNSGIMLVNSNVFFKNLDLIKINKINKEKYLPDIFEIYSKNENPFSFIISPEDEMHGVNTLSDFINVDNILQKKMIKNFIDKGVLISKPETSFFSFDTIIEKGVIIEQNVTIKNNVNIKSGTLIKSNSYIEGAKIEKNCIIGPFARIRPSSLISKNSKIGNFVEVKNSIIGEKSSISHLSYIGDSSIGKNVNIGAGTITCNFDGKIKNKTIIKEGTFIGSNCSLIAPLVINKNVKIGAGSVITQDIPSNNLAIERSQLKIIKKK